MGDVEKAKDSKGLTVFEASKPRAGDKRKREDRGDPGEIDGYKGNIDVSLSECSSTGKRTCK